ncbi:LacI family DNA-binding transcriptional regulator [Kineosporia sp. R_H_3]|uniref:LacI family DNA-binding transcriptional regulator n=1 Tax=Kineosporia sp. R_H_3 TaxID=1961848 RepID=UPI000B4AA82F|nr:LacI family DNA-binding transcriptional regulator [Kineosporia sp. R_H_3]
MSASTDDTARAGVDGGEFRRPTMRDVAARAGVSLKTVSRVVNAEPGVSPALADRVRRAVTELDFRPNVGASSLRRADGKTATVGLLVEDVANPFSSALQRAVEDVAMPRGVVVFSASLDEDPERERELARAFAARRADGLILVPASDDQSYLEAEVRAGTAVVCVDRACRGVDVDSVVATNRSGAAEGVRHLFAGGHRRVAFLGDRQSIWTASERYQGYLDAFAAAGLEIDPSIVVHDLTDTGVADGATSTLLTRPNPPTALFTAQNLVTIGALRALRRLGAERTVALVGFDDFPLADLVTPGVTVVAQDPTAIGKLAASVLFSRLAGDTSPTQLHVVPTTLVRRGSGEIPPPR